MSLFDHYGYRWRETYFLFHDVARRPTVTQFEEAIADLGQHLDLENLKGTDSGHLELATIFAPNAYAAIEISYVEGEEVLEQIETLQKEMTGSLDDPQDIEKLAQLAGCNARLDLLHFEQIVEGDDDDDELCAVFDPGALLLVIGALSELCQGVGVDPASATVI